jgi:alpha-L-arabinofuranosidase
MTTMSRRQFAANVSASLVGAAVARPLISSPQLQQNVGIHLDNEIGTIRPGLHGHFAEHLGSCTYGGLWVGRGSPIPNIDGYRKAAVEYLRALGIPVLRWPGGCFADDYHWRDGVGPAAKRPRTVNIHWGNYTEDNSFGTHEFIGLCRLIGAEPYLAGNVGSGTPEELRDWVEYCNYPSGSSLSDERGANGSAAPFKVKYWGIGNENWGCGGRMTPEQYAANFLRFGTFVREFGDTHPYQIACGPNGNDADWSRRFLETVRHAGFPDGFAMHFYSGGKSQSTRFTVETLEDQLSSFARVEQAIRQQRALLDGFDPNRRVGLLVDEWGVWDRMVAEEEQRYGKLWQQITMRSAVAAALGLNVFHRQADKLVMCNIAQIVNVLHSMLLTSGEKCIRTPAYYAFDLMKEHRGRTAVFVDTGDASPLGLSVSASRKENELVLTCVNPKHDAAMPVRCQLSGGASATRATARVLGDPDFNACNTFENPDRIVPKAHQVAASGRKLSLDLPPMSIVTAVVTLTPDA